jgi:hypothetical protein
LFEPKSTLSVHGNQIEQARDHDRIEGAHLGRAVRCRDHGKPGRMMREHHFEQMPVEPLRARLDLAQIEAGLDIEIVGDRAVLEIEIDQTGRGASARRALQEERGLNCDRSYADASGRRQESENLRLRRVLALRRLLGGARAGAHEFDRRDGLHQKIRDADLQQTARDVLVEELRHHHRGRAARLRGQARQRSNLRLVRRVEIDDNDGGSADRRIVDLREVAFQHLKRNLQLRRERRFDHLPELPVRRDGHDMRRPAFSAVLVHRSRPQVPRLPRSFARHFGYICSAREFRRNEIARLN